MFDLAYPRAILLGCCLDVTSVEKRSALFAGNSEKGLSWRRVPAACARQTQRILPFRIPCSCMDLLLLCKPLAAEWRWYSRPHPFLFWHHTRSESHRWLNHKTETGTSSSCATRFYLIEDLRALVGCRLHRRMYEFMFGTGSRPERSGSVQLLPC